MAEPQLLTVAEAKLFKLIRLAIYPKKISNYMTWSEGEDAQGNQYFILLNGLIEKGRIKRKGQQITLVE